MEVYCKKALKNCWQLIFFDKSVKFSSLKREFVFYIFFAGSLVRTIFLESSIPLIDNG